MKALNILKDRRNPFYIHQLLMKEPAPVLPKKVFFMFTMDVEMGNLKSKQVSKNISATVDMIEEFGKGSFLVDGEVIEKTDPVDLSGHEIGCHGYQHSALGNDWWINKNELRCSPKIAISRGTQLIKDYYGVKPISFRAPKFSISDATFKILANEGYKIDSSAHPHSNKLFPHKLNNLLELPVSRIPKPHIRLNKLIPHLYFDSLMSSTLKKGGVDNFLKISERILHYWNNRTNPFLMLVTHPWEIDKQLLSLFREYFIRLEEKTKLRFITMKEYAKKE